MKNDRFVIKNATKNHKRNDRFYKRSFWKMIVFQNDRFFKLFVSLTIVFKNDRYSFSKSLKRVGRFLKRSFFPKTKQLFLKTIEKRSKKRPFNDRFQKRLTTLLTCLYCKIGELQSFIKHKGGTQGGYYPWEHHEWFV